MSLASADPLTEDSGGTLSLCAHGRGNGGLLLEDDTKSTWSQLVSSLKMLTGGMISGEFSQNLWYLVFVGVPQNQIGLFVIR